MQFGAMEPKSVTARKLNELVKRVEELEAVLAGKAEDKPAKKREKKADVDAVEPTEEASE